MMVQKLDWTKQLGAAFASDKTAVFDSIQRLRAQAQAAGNLKTTPQQEVQTQTSSGGQQVIVIQPANPQVIYVAQYNPQVVYVAAPPPPSSGGQVAAAAVIGFTAGVIIGSSSNHYYAGPYAWRGASMYNQAWEQREDYLEDRQDMYQDNASKRRDASQNNQAQRQSASQSNQAQRQSTSTTNQAQRQSSAAAAQSTSTANQAARQSSAASAQSTATANQAARQSSAQANTEARTSQRKAQLPHRAWGAGRPRRSEAGRVPEDSPVTKKDPERGQRVPAGAAAFRPAAVEAAAAGAGSRACEQEIPHANEK